MMRKGEQNILIRALREPAVMSGLDAGQWSGLLRLARLAALSGRLDWLARQSGVFDQLPARVRSQFTSARNFALGDQRQIRWEVRCLREVLAPRGIRITLLKGAAYLLAGCQTAHGRLCSDVDILVAGDDLARAEAELVAHGWEALKTDAYDDHYYRTWMHELPPLRHRERGMIVDIHHTILPPTSRYVLGGDVLLSRARPLGEDGLMALSEEDMAVHVIVHMMADGDLVGRLRELVDVDALLREFGARAEFWPRFMARAGELGVIRPVYYALRLSRQLLATPVPEAVLRGADQARPAWPVRVLMDRLAPAALTPQLPDKPGRLAGLAGLLLYIRAHWLRMPPLMLARHLARKALRRLSPAS